MESGVTAFIEESTYGDQVHKIVKNPLLLGLFLKFEEGRHRRERSITEETRGASSHVTGKLPHLWLPAILVVHSVEACEPCDALNLALTEYFWGPFPFAIPPHCC